MDEKIAYTVEELVERGCGSRTFLYERIGAGELRATKRGTRTVVLDPDLHALTRRRAGHQAQATTLGHRLAGIDRKIEECLP